jgi:hypothetical protein
VVRFFILRTIYIVRHITFSLLSVTLGQTPRALSSCSPRRPFFDYFTGYAVIFWFPTVLKRQSGFSDLRVGMLGPVPHLVAFIAMLFNGWHSDSSCERRWHAAAPLFITAAGVAVPHHSAKLNSNDGLIVQHDLCVQGVSPPILGDSNGNPK